MREKLNFLYHFPNYEIITISRLDQSSSDEERSAMEQSSITRHWSLDLSNYYHIHHQSKKLKQKNN